MHVLPQYTRVRYPEDFKPGATFAIPAVYAPTLARQLDRIVVVICLYMPWTDPWGSEVVHMVMPDGKVEKWYMNECCLDKWTRLF